MFVLKHNHDRTLFRLLILDHGFVNFRLLFLLILPYATAQTGPRPPPPPTKPFSSLGSQFNPTIAIIMVILIIVFFLMGFFSIYIRRWTERRFPHPNSDPYAALNTGANRRSRRGFRGLDESVISTFPTFQYSAVKGLKIGKGSLECAVCLNEFEDDEMLRLIPKCSHVFHTACIDAWLTSHNTCPVCRANLVPQPGETLSSDAPIFNTAGDSAERSDNIQEISHTEQGRDVECAEVSLTNQNRPPRSRSTGWRLTGLFPRSHSTGHSLVQPGENCERFTLRLPEEVRNQLMNSSLHRSKSCVAFTRVSSSRKGFRSGSGGFGRGRNYNFYERFDRPSRSGHWGRSLTLPFVSRTGSVRSAKPSGDGVEVSCPPTKNLFKSAKTPCDRLAAGGECDGEQSSDRLRPSDNLV